MVYPNNGNSNGKFNAMLQLVSLIAIAAAIIYATYQNERIVDSIHRHEAQLDYHANQTNEQLARNTEIIKQFQNHTHISQENNKLLKELQE